MTTDTPAATPLLRIEQGYPVADLVEWPGNARRHDVDSLDESVTDHGQFRTVLARELPDGRLQLLSGHGTRAAIERSGRAHIDVEVRDVPDDRKARRIVLASNATHDRGGYDERALLALLDEASADGGLTGTGYDGEAYAALLDTVHGDGQEPGPGGAAGNVPDDDDIDDKYREQYGVIVICDTEGDQQRTYEELRMKGFNCRVVTT